ncbi:MAG: DUF3822 family protein [Paludibacteraceae bacterium]|nr:DUF3822 family protein [Paludibacteraceae bacterium]
MQETGNNSNSQRLSICFSAGGFSFSVAGKEKSIAFQTPDTHFARSMAVCLCEPDIWNDYSSVTVQIDDEPTSMIPSSVFSASDCLNIMKFNYPSLDFNKYTVEFHNIDGFDISNIIAVDNELMSFIKEYLPFANITHISSALTTAALKSSRTEDRQELWINISTGAMYVALANKGELVFSNRYNITSDTDILYWLAAIFTQFKLSGQTTHLFITGNISCMNAIKERVVHCSQATL